MGSAFTTSSSDISTSNFNKDIRLMVTGKTGAGKSTLLNGILGEKLFKEGDDFDPQTLQVESHTFIMKNGINITVFDTPGLQDGSGNEEAYLEDMQNKCTNIHLLIYCINMSENRTDLHVHNSAIKKITDHLGPGVWENAVIVLTFANTFENRLKDKGLDGGKLKAEFKAKLKEWESTFHSALKAAGVPEKVCKNIHAHPAGHPASYKPSLISQKYWLSNLSALFTRMTNLRAKLDTVTKERQQYIKRLEELMTDKDTIDLCYLKVFLVGPPGVGKTTTLNRLLKVFTNICSAEYQPQSTLLANCVQVQALIGNDSPDWQYSKSVDEEAKLLFGHLKSKICVDKDDQQQKQVLWPTHFLRFFKNFWYATGQGISSQQHFEPTKIPEVSLRLEHSKSTNNEAAPPIPPQNKLTIVISNMKKLIVSGDYSAMAEFFGTSLLNINDIGGQPGFLEMLPALSTGPAMYLLFLDLSKDLDKSYKIPFSRDDTIITPFDATHTVEATISQLLSAVASVHRFSQRSASLTESAAYNQIFSEFQQISPVAILIGTHMDCLANPDERIEQTDRALKMLIQKFPTIFPSSSDSGTCFFSVDNYAGTEESDIGPLRKFINEIIDKQFRKASLPICPKWLFFGAILRKEYKIVKIEDCFEIGKFLEMDEEDIKFCIWYLDCIGTLMHYTNVADDTDDWLKTHVICSPQIIFDSISQLILVSLQTLHSEGHVIEQERAQLIKKGQFSIESIEKYCYCDKVTKKLEKKELIPVKQLIKLLNYLNLLSPITHKRLNGKEDVTYLMPAVLDSVSPDELIMPPPPDANNPAPLHITFECGFVPTGSFCGLITRLVTLGPNGILGLTWELVEEGVKRNCVSFFIAKTNIVTLISHERSYEIRVTRNHTRMSLHDLCSYVLTVILHTLKSLYKQLVSQIAFCCLCCKFSQSISHLCVLNDNFYIQFVCGSNPIALRSEQQVWLGKLVTSGSLDIEVLKFAEAKSNFSFYWTKEGSSDLIETTGKPNVLTFQSVREEDLGYYRCEVKEAGGVVLTLYRALYRGESTTSHQLGESITRSDSVSTSQRSDVSKNMSSKGAHATLEEFSKKCNLSRDQLDCEIEESDVIYLAQHFDNVALYLRVFGLTPAEQADIRRIMHVHDNHVAMAECLSLWRQHNPSTATLRKLLEILLRLRKEEIATNVCKFYCPTSK